MEQFPDVLLASLAGLHRTPLFVATEQDRADIDAGARLKA
jgi:hypothetical protein